MNNMKIESLKQLRATLIKSSEEIKGDWELLGVEYDHYLSESLADLTIKLEENLNLINQAIGEVC